MAAQPIPAPAKPDWDAILHAAVKRRMVRMAEIPETCPQCGRDTSEAEWSSDDQQTWLACSCGEVVYDE